MAKVGPFIVDPKAGAYCRITLDSGEKILVNHDKGGFKGGRLTVEVPKFLGLSSDQVFACDLDAPEGKAALAQLTDSFRMTNAAGTPLGAFVEYIKDCRSVADVKTKCSALLSPVRGPSGCGGQG
jgi:hypothetical protein